MRDDFYEKRPLTKIEGVWDKRAALIEKELGIKTSAELLSYYPYRYVDRSNVYKISDITSDGAYIQIRGKITNVTVKNGQKGTQRLVAVLTDGRDFIDLTWFTGIQYVVNKLKTGEEYVVFGKTGVYNGRPQMTHPDIETVAQSEVSLKSGHLMGMYNTTERMKRQYLATQALRNIIVSEIKKTLPTHRMAECLPQYLIDAFKLISHHEAIEWIHCPKSTKDLEKARLRLKFEELFFIELKLQKLHAEHKTFVGIKCDKVGEYFNGFYNDCLKFPLTGAQKRVVTEIYRDMRSGTQMNRLVQGDVGSGKTVVAVMSMLIALDNGAQACMMAPTEILATQHFESVYEMLAPLGVKVALLTGSTKKKVREKMHEGLVSGEIQILIGTHAVLQDKVEFRNLGLVVIDEQHKFGVEQRATLRGKGRELPHILVMTATPIPRTLAMTLYGDLDISIINELPPGRKPVYTSHFMGERYRIYDFIKAQIREGRQAYIVFPMIDENEKYDYHDLTTGYENICNVFPTPEYNVAMVHGRMKPAEKDAQMQKFASGEAQILVATTVIEVGVNVPNASVMVIEGAERFGLSQLHQLRGRVGRGADQSHCILVTDGDISAETRKRMRIMTESTDGFYIADADLKIRGEGDIEGTQQSGVGVKLKIARIAEDAQLVGICRDAAKKIIEADPMLLAEGNRVLREELEARTDELAVWGNVS